MTVTFRLERPDGTSAEPPSFRTGVYVWRPGETISLGGKSVRVVSVREDEVPVLVVEDVS